MSAGHAGAAEPSWPSGPYNYFVVDQDVRAVLEQFGHNLSIPMRVSEGVEAKRLKGKLNAASPREFLQWLCDSYGLSWYYDGAVLHVFARTELRNVYFDLGAVSFEDLNQRLVNAGIADERFAIKRTAEPHLISVVGPPVYTTLVRQMLNALRDTARAPAPQPEPVAAPKREEPRPAPAPEQKPEPPKRVKQASPLDGESSAPQSPVQRATPVAPAASASSTASRPTAWQNMGIELKLTSAEEKKRLTRMLQREGENQRGNENAGVMVFRGGRR